jgi:hypothetical protein
MQMYLNVGDWSEDGHNKCDRIRIESNKPVADVQQAYLNACEISGMSFHNDWGGTTPNPVLTEYEERELSKENCALLLKHGVPLDVIIEDDYIDPWMFADMWCEFIKIGDPELVCKQIKDDTPNINGFWDKKLNKQFGYGLFCL